MRMPKFQISLIRKPSNNSSQNVYRLDKEKENPPKDSLNQTGVVLTLAQKRQLCLAVRFSKSTTYPYKTCQPI